MLLLINYCRSRIVRIDQLDLVHDLGRNIAQVIGPGIWTAARNEACSESRPEASATLEYSIGAS